MLCFLSLLDVFFDWSNRESQEFVEKFEGALGKGKGRKLYAYKVMMTKVINSSCKCADAALIHFG